MKVYLGTTESTGAVVAIPEGVRKKHLAIFGKSGVGKTTLMRNMAFADLWQDVGLSVVDPHGSLVDDLLSSVPRARTNDVIYLNPALSRVPGINILEAVREADRPVVVSSVISIMRKLWPANWGPRSEWILEHALYALLASREPVTLLSVPKLLIDAAYRKDILRHVTDPAVQQFFHIFENQHERLREESIAPLLNKLGKFSANPLLRAVIGQARSTFDFRRLMDERRVLLCSLSKGALGEDVSSLLGSLIVTKLALASLSRQDTPEDKRTLHVLYADEIQNFSYGIDFPTILAESRKYSLALVVGTQTLAQLPEPSIAAVFGNCASIVSFRISGEDAKALVKEFGVSGDEARRTADQWFDVIIPAAELQNLPDYKMYLRTLVDRTPADPVKVDTFPALTADASANTRERVIRASLERFGRDRGDIEARLSRLLAA